jgi:hypothetical protein
VRIRVVTSVDPCMCWGHRAQKEALLEYSVLELRDMSPIFLVQPKYVKSKTRVTVKSHMLSLRNNRAWPGSQRELVMIYLRRRHRENNISFPFHPCAQSPHYFHISFIKRFY